MRRLNRKPFDQGKTLICRIELTSNGRVFKAGEVFPWKTLGVTEQRLFELWDAFYLEVAPPKAATAKA